MWYVLIDLGTNPESFLGLFRTLDACGAAGWEWYWYFDELGSPTCRILGG